MQSVINEKYIHCVIPHTTSFYAKWKQFVEDCFYFYFSLVFQLFITGLFLQQSLYYLLHCKIQNGLPFWCQLTQVVLKKRPLNGCGSSSSSSHCIITLTLLQLLFVKVVLNTIVSAFCHYSES